MITNYGVEANIDEALRKIEELKAILEEIKEEEIDDKERMRREVFIDTVRRIKNKKGVKGVRVDMQRDRIIVER